MQHGPKRAIVEGFRGVGKSWICSAFVVHQLLLDPTKNILVVSASKTRADDFSTFTLRLIHEIPFLDHLKPNVGSQRFSKISFDVGPAPASHAPSVKSLGITSQLTGSRADLIVGDDVEVPTNAATQTMRDKLSEQIKEFDSILKPLDDSKIIFLGTPQCEDTVYTKLSERGYKPRIWTARTVTSEHNEKRYDGAVSDLCVDPDAGKSTEPLRFSDIDLSEREVSYGRSGFTMQFMLDPRLSDLDRHPLKINDLVVMDCDKDTAPEKIVWAQDPQLEWDSSVPNVGFNGDRFHRPFKTIGDSVDYSGSVMAIDPSGRGKDETSWAIVKMLNGFLYVVDAGGMQGGYGEDVLKSLAVKAAKQKVNYIVTESNFGDGMFSELFRPILNKIHPCSLEEVRHHTQKEKRIVDTLEPVMNQHRLVIDPKVIRDDYKSAQEYPSESILKYQLMYQLSRITRDRGAITHDDRLDALAMAVSYWVEQMAQDADNKIRERKDDILTHNLQEFMDQFHKTKGNQTTTWM